MGGPVTACTPSSTPSSVAASAAPNEQRARAQQVLDDFVTAARAGHTAAAGALVSATDPTFAGQAAVWAANLSGVPWSRLSWTARTAQAPLAADRRAVLGQDAWVQQVDLTWALPGERRTADEQLWLTFVEQPTADGGSVTRLAGDGDGPTADAALPSWLQQPVRLLRHDDVLLLTDADDADRWLTQASAAWSAVDDRVGAARRDRQDVLVVEVPQSRAVFERTLGVAAGSYAAVAAAAWPMGSDTSTAPVHVVVNPEASRQLSTLGRDVLLVHEAVHVATRSPGSPVPTWLVEGYADEIAYRAHPTGRAPAERTVRDHVREYGVPESWPAEDDFAADAADLDLSYDLAWTAARSIADGHGQQQLSRFYAALDDGDSMAEAAERIGTTEAALLKQWRQDLRASADR